MIDDFIFCDIKVPVGSIEQYFVLLNRVNMEYSNPLTTFEVFWFNIILNFFNCVTRRLSQLNLIINKIKSLKFFIFVSIVANL